MLLSGRPMIVTDALPMADAFVAAWLPGTEGQGVADVLFGDYKPTGKLAFTWPRSGLSRGLPRAAGSDAPGRSTGSSRSEPASSSL